MTGAELMAHSANDAGEWHLLVDHLRGTAERAADFGAAFESEEVARLAGLVHDAGKADPAWQAYLRSVAAGHAHPMVDHKHAGMYLARDAGLGPLLAPVIAGHHGGMPWSRDGLARALADGPTPGQAKALEALAELGIRVTDRRADVPAFAMPRRADEASFRAAELWSRMVFSTLVDADHLDTEAHFRPDRAELRQRPDVQMADLVDRFDGAVADVIGSRSADPVAEARLALRQRAGARAAEPRGWYELTAPTGSGKTIAGLSFALRHALAHGLRRVITAVPFISVTEQVATAYRAILDRPGSAVVVEHHSALGEVSDTGQVGDELTARIATENWDATVLVTTTVQLLESLFDNRPSRCRKLHRLARAVIVLDEVQAIPWRILEPTLEVLRSLVSDYGASVLLTTATQPPLHLIPTANHLARTELVPRSASAVFDRVVAAPLASPMDLDRVSGVASDLAERHGGQCLIVVNSVADARQLVRSLVGTPGLHHLSTRMCMAHRRDVLQRMLHDLEAEQACVLVSTQLIEAGVDIDFPVALRATAPLPSVIQTAGRVNRHGLRASGTLGVVEILDGRMPPEEYFVGANLTRDLMRDGLDLLAPDTLAVYYERFLEYTKDKLDHFDVQRARRDLNFPEVARRYRVIVDDSVGVLVPYQAFDPTREHVPDDPRARRQWVRSVQPFVVSLRTRDFARSVQDRTVVPMAPGIWRWMGQYDPITGLVADTTTEGTIW
jgi:CRISPR-associated endonuclease/helicase Cas3